MAAIVVLVILVALIAVGMSALKRRGRREELAGKWRPNIDPFTVGEPWRRHVSSALSTQRRFDEIVKGVAAGPTRDRLVTVGGQLRHGVDEMYAIAKRGNDLDTAIGQIDSPALRRQLDAASDDVSRAALQSQLDAAMRMKATRDATDAQLKTMNLRLGELVAQAAEVSVGTGQTAELGTALDDLVTQMEALRLAVADVEAVRRGVQLPPELDLAADPPPAAAAEQPDDPGTTATST